MSRYIPAFAGSIDPSLEKHISDTFGLPPLLSRMLIRRGITEDRLIEDFLEPAAAPMQTPFIFPEMKNAVDRIHDAVLEDEKICVYGDYDADGICATAILMKALSKLTEKTDYYIPSRHHEGYGINCDAVRRIKEGGASLIITVDNGITANEEIAYAKTLGIDVIVTDHHEPQGRHPDCVAVLSAADDPGVPPLCGAGVAMKLATALLPDTDPMEFMPLAAIATVADMVPLHGENRTIVALGLPAAYKILGVSSILKSASYSKKRIDEGTAAFCIAPRLNASGRMDHASGAVSLLLEDDESKAVSRASLLEELNRLRREEETSIFEQAREQVIAAFHPGKRLITVKGMDWNVGVVGIVASRLVEEYHVPAIVFSENDSGILTGSGRSVPGVNLFEAISNGSDLIIRYGGHSMAAGITLRAENYTEFSARVQEYIAEQYDGSVFASSYYYEEKLSVSEIPLSTVRAMERLAPFGEGNDLPLFLLEDIRFENVREIGKEKQHLSADIVQSGTGMRTIAFYMGRLSGLIRSGGAYDAIVSAGIDAFRGNESVELTLRSFRRHPDPTYKIESDFFSRVLYNALCAGNREDAVRIAVPYADVFYGMDLSRKAMAEMYKAFQKLLLGRPVQIGDLVPVLMKEQFAALAVFIELGLVDADSRLNVVSMPGSVQSCDLRNSTLYRWLVSLDSKK